MHVLIVDDHPILHETLGAVARAAVPDAEIHVESNLGDALTRAGRLQAGLRLVLLDLGLPGYTGTEALMRFRTAFPEPRVVVVSATEDPETVEAALQSGAAGYIPKTTTPVLMVAALKLVVSGGTYSPAQVARANRRTPELGLTPRQTDVLRSLLRGLSYRHIARRLKISENTVRQHAHSAYKTLGVASRTEAFISLVRRGFKID